jgi:hypothetical protein
LVHEHTLPVSTQVLFLYDTFTAGNSQHGDQRQNDGKEFFHGVGIWVNNQNPRQLGMLLGTKEN